MSTCQSCVFWHRHSPGILRLGDCMSDSWIATYNIPDEVTPGSVFVECDEGWGFYTDRAFGCIHHSERTEAA